MILVLPGIERRVGRNFAYLNVKRPKGTATQRERVLVRALGEHFLRQEDNTAGSATRIITDFESAVALREHLENNGFSY